MSRRIHRRYFRWIISEELTKDINANDLQKYWNHKNRIGIHGSKSIGPVPTPIWKSRTGRIKDLTVLGSLFVWSFTNVWVSRCKLCGVIIVILALWTKVKSVLSKSFKQRCNSRLVFMKWVCQFTVCVVKNPLLKVKDRVCYAIRSN